MMPAGNTNMNEQVDLDACEKLFLALSDRTRLRLLAMMADGPVSVGYLAEQLAESQPKTSRHLAYLRNSGLVATSREGKHIYYQIEAQPDRAIQSILAATLRLMTGNTVTERNQENRITDDTSAKAYISDWKPNEIEVFLL